MKKMTIRISDFEHSLLHEHCRAHGITLSDFVCQAVRSIIILAEPEYSDATILQIAKKARRTPMFVERILNKYPGNWKMQVQGIFMPSSARISASTCLEDFLKTSDPDFTTLAVTVATATGFGPIRVERILKKYPLNIELQILELFRALEPRIEAPGEVSLKIGDSRNIYPLNSLDDFAKRVHTDIQQTLPTDFDVARLTKLIEEEQDDMPSNKDFGEWLKEKGEQE